MLRTIARVVGMSDGAEHTASDTEEADYMAWRIIGGVAGWLASLAPLVVVNALALVTTISPEVISIAGGAGLIVGIALGGLTAGLLGGKRDAGWGGAIAGAIAAALFAATLIGLIFALRAQQQLPNLLAMHLVRAIGAVGFIACLIMAVAAGVGILAGGRQARLADERAPVAQPARMPGRQPSGPVSPPYTRPGFGGAPPRESARLSRPAQPTQPTPPGFRGQRDSRPTTESRSRERSSRW